MRPYPSYITRCPVGRKYFQGQLDFSALQQPQDDFAIFDKHLQVFVYKMSSFQP
jgi:hypothetical protein